MNKTEKTYVDMLSELQATIATDIIPERDKEEILELVYELERRLWKYSA